MAYSRNRHDPYIPTYALPLRTTPTRLTRHFLFVLVPKPHREERVTLGLINLLALALMGLLEQVFNNDRVGRIEDLFSGSPIALTKPARLVEIARSAGNRGATCEHERNTHSPCPFL